MSDPSKELAILNAFKNAILQSDTFGERQVLVMPGVGQGSLDMPAAWIYPGEAEKTHETNRTLTYTFTVSTVVIVSDETRDVPTVLFNAARDMTREIMKERYSLFGLPFLLEMELIGAGSPESDDPGMLSTAMRAVIWAVRYRTTSEEIVSA